MESKILEKDSAYDEAQLYAKSWRGRWAKLAKETGLGYHWIQSFSQGRIQHPSIRRIDALLKHKASKV